MSAAMTSHAFDTPASLLFMDTETTGLDPDRHQIWEVAAIRRDYDPHTHQPTERDPMVWHLPVDLGLADPMALAVGGFHDRYRNVTTQLANGGGTITRVGAGQMATFARDFMDLARGCHLVGAVPSFDDERLRKLLRGNGACESWHYHLIDVEALAIGHLANMAQCGQLATEERHVITPPWRSDDLTAALGIDGGLFEKHTALGDARWAQAIYDMIVPAPETIDPF